MNAKIIIAVALIVAVNILDVSAASVDYRSFTNDQALKASQDDASVQLKTLDDQTRLMEQQHEYFGQAIDAIKKQAAFLTAEQQRNLAEKGKKA